MHTQKQDAVRMSPATSVVSAENPETLLTLTIEILEDAKAEDIVTIDLAGKSSLGDYMVVSSGRSNRHVSAIADKLSRELRDRGLGRPRVEGKDHNDWVLIDAGNIIIHVFRPEVREFYNLEKMWLAERPEDQSTQ